MRNVSIIRVCRVIVGLNVGGAELRLKRLIGSHYGDANYRHAIISFVGIGAVWQQVQALGYEVHAVGRRLAPNITRVT